MDGQCTIAPMQRRPRIRTKETRKTPVGSRVSKAARGKSRDSAFRLCLLCGPFWTPPPWHARPRSTKIHPILFWPFDVSPLPAVPTDHQGVMIHPILLGVCTDCMFAPHHVAGTMMYFPVPCWFLSRESKEEKFVPVLL